MKKTKTYAVLLFCSFFFVKGYTQDKSDIGLMITNDKSNAIMVEYRKPFGEKSHFKIGASIGADYFNSPFKVIDANDTIVIERYSGSMTSSSFLRIGVERQIKTSMFYYGVDLLLGYHSNERFSANEISTLDTYGNWQPKPFNETRYFEERVFGGVKDHYFVSGLQLNVSMDVPLGDKFLLNLQYASQFTIYQYIKSTDRIDPLNEYGGYGNGGFSYDGRFGIGLKYKLGKKESSPTEDL